MAGGKGQGFRQVISIKADGSRDGEGEQAGISAAFFLAFCLGDGGKLRLGSGWVIKPLVCAVV